MSDRRSNPDKLLNKVQDEEAHSKKGRLKIYLGAAPGVGKTYSMLKDAIQDRQNGRDVLIGIIESHGRKDIESLFGSLDVLPLQDIPWHNKILREFSLDEAIQRHPGLILIDEMAHTNAPGLRHTKRWQDIQELLDNQIDVYTTLNVQHIESLNDDVSRIIHAPVHETVPDFMLDLADEIELVDLPTAELLKRLHEGKIYIPERAETAAKHFFLEGNLIALREVALRATAQRVGKQVQIYRQDRGIRHVWASHEKIIVCVGPGIESLQLIRNGKQLAASLQCEWMAVHVNSATRPETEAQKNNTIQFLRLAEQLGAETCQLTGVDIVGTLMEFARDQNITLMMIWKSVRSRWREFFSRQTANELVRQSGEIDVYIMTGKPGENTLPKTTSLHETHPSVRPWLITGFILLVATAANFLFGSPVHPDTQAIFFLLAIPLIALMGKVLPVVIGVIYSLTLLIWQFFPSDYSIILACISGIVFTTLSGIILFMKRQVETERQTAWRANTLHKLSKQLTQATDTTQIVDFSKQYLANLLDSQVTFYLGNITDNRIQLNSLESDNPDTREMDALLWVYRMGKMAGLGTDTLPTREALYLPLLARRGPIGVMRVQPLQPHRLFEPEQIHILETCANQISLAIELLLKQDEASQASLDNRLEHSRIEFMQSIARDLNPPVSSIIAYTKILESLAQRADPEKILKTAQFIHSESYKISHLVNNLLQISRINQGLIQPVRESIKLKKMIESLIADRYHGEQLFTLDIPDDLNALSVDDSMMREVFLNLMDNAVRVSPEDETVRISAKKTDEMIEICITNKGPRIPPEELEKIFEKYYQIDSTPKAGLGLGLAICRKIVEAHGGKIWAQTEDEQGSVFCFTLPIARKKKK